MERKNQTLHWKILNSAVRATLLFIIILLFSFSVYYFFAKKKENSSPAVFVSGGVVPHHLLAEKIIDEFFSRLKAQSTKKLIILGPNHLPADARKTITGVSDWQTQFGKVIVDKKNVQEITVLEFAEVDEDTIQAEHSISTLMPFVKKYLPNIKLVPVIVTNDLNADEIEKLSEKIAKITTKETVLIASVDFSHYLKAKDAEEFDKKTIQAIENFDYQKLLSFDNKYLDSPASIVLLLKAMEKPGKRQMEILAHTNSGKLYQDSVSGTTSYFSMVFY